MQALTPIRRRSVVDDTFEALRARILHGAWAPGEPLPTEAALTAALGVSRSTVREALNRLASAGLVRIAHGSTKRVLDFRDHAGLEVLSALLVDPEGEIDLRVVRAATEMRAALVPDIARLAAQRRTPAQARRLVELAAALDKDDDLEALLEATLIWWTELVHASDNLAYRLSYNTLRSTYREGRPAMMAVLAEELRWVEGYRTVSASVRDRQPDAARRHAQALVELGTRALLTAIDIAEEAS